MPPPFDVELAPRLHGQALHQLVHALLADRSAADDVVADTFAAALQRPPREARSLGGWLRVAAHNLARKWRRSEQRRRRREQQAARGEVQEDAAAVVVAREEMLQRVVDAVKGLEQPYRDAIWQRWFEELTPTAIAAQSGVPLATVKSRLQRGLAMLRARMSRAGEDGDWRAALAAAFGAGAEVGGATATGAVLMGTGAKVMVGAVAAMSVAAMWWWARCSEPAAVPVARAEALPIAASTADRSVAPVSNDRREVMVPAAAAEAAPAASHLRGRVVAAENGLPLAGCELALKTGKREQHQTSTADGRFEFTFHGGDVELRVQGPGRALGDWKADTFPAGRSEDLGDVMLRRGVTVRGRVVDEHGRPLADQQLLIWDVPAGIRPGDGAPSIIDCKSDARGEFAFERALPQGRWKFSILGEREVVAPESFVVDVDRELPPIVVQTALLSRISGIAVDDRGLPVPLVLVATAGGASETRTDPTGRFTLLGSKGDGASTRIVVEDPATCDVCPPTAEVPWGTKDVRLVLPRALSFELRVVDENDAPVEDYGVLCRPSGLDVADPLRFLRLRGHHEQGTVVVDRVRRGRNWLRVMPQSAALSPSTAVALEVGDGPLPPQRVVVRSRQACRVRVVTGDAVPVAAATVTAWRSFGKTDHLGLFDPRQGEASMPDDLRREVVSRDTTDVDGICELWIDRDRGDLALRVEHPAHPLREWRRPPLAPGPEPLLLRLQEAGSLVGRVELDGTNRQELQVWCEPLDVGAARARCLELLPDGTFSAHGLPVGLYRLFVANRFVCVEGSGCSSTFLPVAATERRVAVTAGAPPNVLLEAPRHRPATLRGRLRVDGAVPPGLRVCLVFQHDRDMHAVRGVFVPDADGAFVATGLMPGNWRLAVSLGRQVGSTLPAVQAETIPLAEGEVAERSLAVTRRRLTLRVQEPDGSPFQGRVMLRAAGATGEQACKDGRLVLDPAPAVPIRIARFDRARLEDRGLDWSDPVQMPQDRTEAEVTVMLPASGS